MRPDRLARLFPTFVVVLLLTLAQPRLRAGPNELRGGFRLPQKNGWTFVHLEGTPHQIGFQNGYLLAPEIQDTLNVVKLETGHDDKKPWSFFRDAAEHMMWPHIEPEYREELQGIADGVSARGIHMDVWDVVGLNALTEWEYYNKQYDRQHGLRAATNSVPEHCSAFVATGSYTKDGKVVIAHNNWSSYLEGERWTMIYDIVPAQGYRMLMDGLPGVIHSADDFVVNAAGMAITETTIGHFSGYDSNGIPEFVRARKAAQYSASIDDFTRIMRQGNNGGYANTWLLADTRNNEIGRLELGLKNVTLARARDGYFVGSNFPINEKLIREETDFNPNDLAQSSLARHARWNQLMAENKGKIDVRAAERFLADHYDVIEKKQDPDERTLDGHIDLSPRGSGGWVGPYGLAGAVQNKAADASMIANMSFTAAAGHACGHDFKSAEHIQAHPEYAWERALNRDLDAYPWTSFSISRQGTSHPGAEGQF
jgi:Phospholipase B